jgi:hypothetical protein
MNKEELRVFLNEANRSTYANKEAPKVTSTRLGSEDYHFEKDNLIYHDTYFGSRDFIGEEIVYKDGEAVWGANYYGYVLDENAKTNEVYAFLRKALMHESDELVPVRGPTYFKEGEWGYRNTVEGDLGRCKGTEEILFADKVVYRLDYHGGFIG